MICYTSSPSLVSPTITASPTDLTVPAISDHMFTCSAEGLPRPSFSWIRHNGNNSLLIDVNVNTQYSITYADIGDRGSTSSLYIANVSPFEVGDYLCVANNVLGQATAQGSLTVYSKCLVFDFSHAIPLIFCSQASYNI